MSVAIGKEQFLFVAFQYLVKLCFCLADVLNQLIGLNILPFQLRLRLCYVPVQLPNKTLCRASLKTSVQAGKSMI